MFDKIKVVVKSLLWWHSSHDLDHTMRVHDMCVYLWKKEWADIEILKIASLLHDIWRQKQHETQWKICHAEYGTKLSKNILEGLKLEDSKINKILHCISTHRFRKGNQPKSLEAKILFDADKLDSIWAVWIWRAFMYANEVWAKVHNDEHINILDTNEHWPEDTAYREYVVKLQKIKNKMFTESWRDMAVKKHKIMVDFFERLNEEVRGIKKLQ